MASGSTNFIPTFWFASAEWFRSRLGAGSGCFRVPTPEMYQGDFCNWVNSSGAMLPIYGPGTTRPNPSGSGSVRDPFPGNLIPQDRFSTIARNYLSILGNTAFPNNGAALVWPRSR